MTPKYLEEPRGILKGNNNSILALPKSTQEVSIIVKTCQEYKISITPYSGGTGLVGGQLNPSQNASIILSIERMVSIRNLYEEEKVVIVEAGIILEQLQNLLSKENLFFPLSLASEGSCRIGGNLATNAGGVQVLKYGSTRDLCLGIEAVLPNGQIFNGLKRLRKDNTGYDLKNLLVGSEGTLGIITAASLRLFPKPSHFCTAIVAVESPREALKLLNFAQKFLDNRVSSFELIGQKAAEFVAKCLPQIKVPIEAHSEWFVLIEATSSSSRNIELEFENFIQLVFEKELVQDGIIAQMNLEEGEYIDVGKILFAIVDEKKAWLEANLKETDLTNIKVGQSALFIPDSYPNSTWNAQVESISPATGAEFSILPPQNSSGNWVKVVQRIPVRLSISDLDNKRTKESNVNRDLRVGMSVSVTIDTKHEVEVPLIIRPFSKIFKYSIRHILSSIHQIT